MSIVVWNVHLDQILIRWSNQVKHRHSYQHLFCVYFIPVWSSLVSCVIFWFSSLCDVDEWLIFRRVTTWESWQSLTRLFFLVYQNCGFLNHRQMVNVISINIHLQGYIRFLLYSISHKCLNRCDTSITCKFDMHCSTSENLSVHSRSIDPFDK